MRRSRISGAAVLLVLITLPAAVAAIPPELVARDNIPMAITQPLAGVPASPMLGGDARSRRLPESGLIVLVGTALMGLASIVRRSTRV